MIPKLTNEQKQALVQLVLAYTKASDSKLAEKTEAWEYAERMIQSYAPQAHAERRSAEAKEEDKFTKLRIPYGYAMLMAQHTYLCSVFLGRSPILQYIGRNNAGQNAVMELEAIVDYQVEMGNMAVPMYVALFDVLVYGLCSTFQSWVDKRSYITAYMERQKIVEGVPVLEDGVPLTETVEEIHEVKGYRGSELINVKPKDLIVDPTVGFLKFQDGQCVGRRLQMSVQAVKEGEKDGLFFDTELITASYGKDNDLLGDNSAMIETAEPATTTQLDHKRIKGFVNCIELYVKLVPSEHGLGTNDREEIWVLTVADKKRLIGAAPAGWLHGMFPVDIGTAEYDGYTLTSRGTPEIARPLNDTMNWLINTHMYNVEKSVNNEYLYDPSMINMRDFLDPRPGKRIRIKPEAYGKDVRTFIHQFQQYDYTQKNLQDVQFVEALFQRVFGINEQMLGALSAGGRKTATEVRSAAGFALNRLKVFSEFFGRQYFAPLSRKLASASRQMYTAEDKFSIIDAKDSAEFREFTADQIAGEFDYAPVDGSIPVDRMAQVTLLKEVLAAISQLPAIAGRYDVAKFFEHMIKMLGIKNMQSFEITDPAQIIKESVLGQQVVGGNSARTNSTGTTPNTGVSSNGMADATVE